MAGSFLKSLQVITEDGNTYSLYSGDNPSALISLDGAGVATVRRLTKQSPKQNGVTDRGFRLEPRRMILTLQIYQQDEARADDMRDKLAEIFSSTLTPLKLLATRLDNGQRQIDCFLDGAIDFPQSERKGASQRVIIPLFAPDPTFYSPVQQALTQLLPSLPVSITSIPAAGLTADDWPVIEITGPVTNLIITHSPISDRIDLTGATIPAGEVWVFDLRQRHRAVYRQSDGANRLQYITPGNLRDLSTIRLVNQKLARSYSQTANGFVLDGSGVTAATQIVVRYYKRYLSL